MFEFFRQEVVLLREACDIESSFPFSCGWTGIHNAEFALDPLEERGSETCSRTLQLESFLSFGDHHQLDPDK